MSGEVRLIPTTVVAWRAITVITARPVPARTLLEDLPWDLQETSLRPGESLGLDPSHELTRILVEPHADNPTTRVITDFQVIDHVTKDAAFRIHWRHFE